MKGNEMQNRFNFMTASPETTRAVAALDSYIKESGLPRHLIHLIKLRASILNGCVYCVDMHVKEARRDGLSEQWINLMSVWQEAAVYSEAERAVLGWTDSLTLLAQTKAPDADYEPLTRHFNPEEITKITAAIGTINVWNRLAVGMRMQHPIDVKKAS
jgi:AhpD family alkylhydroperoxidase